MSNPFINQVSNPFLDPLPFGGGSGSNNPFLQPEPERERGFVGGLLHEVGLDLKGAFKTIISPFGEAAEALGLDAPVTFEDLSTRDLTGAAMIASMFVGGAALKGLQGAGAAAKGLGTAAEYRASLSVLQRAGQAAMAEGAAGAFFGSIKPLESGESRLNALMSDAALFGTLGGGFSMIGSAVRSTIGVKITELKTQAKNVALAQMAKAEESRTVLQEFAGVRLRNPASGADLSIRRHADGKVHARGMLDGESSTRTYGSFNEALSEALGFGYTEKLGLAQTRLNAELKALQQFDSGLLDDLAAADGNVAVSEAIGAIDLSSYQAARDWAKHNWEQAQEVAWLSVEALAENTNEYGMIALKPHERSGILHELAGNKQRLAQLDDSALVREALKQGRLSLSNLKDGVEIRQMVREIFVNDRIIGEGMIYQAMPSYDASFLAHVMTPQTLSKIHPEIRPIFEMADASTRAYGQSMRNDATFMAELRNLLPASSMRQVAEIIDKSAEAGGMREARALAKQLAQESGSPELAQTVERVVDKLQHRALGLVGAGRLGTAGDDVAEEAVARARQLINEASIASPNGAAAEAAALQLAEAEGLVPVVEALMESAGRKGYFPIRHQVGDWRLSVDGLPEGVEYQLFHSSREEAMAELEKIVGVHGARNASILPRTMSFDGGTAAIMSGPEYNKLVKAIHATEGIELSAAEIKDLLAKAGVEPGSLGSKPLKFSQHLQERKLGWREFTEDPFKTLEFYLLNTDRTIAFNEFERMSQKVIDAIPDSKPNLKRWADSYNASMLGRPTAIEKQVQPLLEWLKPDVGPRALKRYSGTLRHLTGLSRLGGALSGVVNLTQTAINTAPVLGTRWTAEGMRKLMTPAGLHEVRQKFGAAGIDLGLHMSLSREGELVAGEGIRDHVIAAYKRAGHGEKSEAVKQGLAALERLWMLSFNGAERFNRSVAAWGAYKKGLAEGMDEAGALAYAREIVEKTQFNYRQSNIPLAMQGPVGGLLGQFKTFFINEIELFATVDNATRAKMMASFAALGGAGALLNMPGADLVNVASGLLFDKRLDEIANIEGGKAGAPAMTRALTFGAFGLAGLDMSDYVGPGGFHSLLQGWAGPFGSDAIATTKFLAKAPLEFVSNGKVNEETYNEFFQRVLPSQIRRISRGMDIIGSGEVRNAYTHKLIYNPESRMRAGALQMFGAPPVEMTAERAADAYITRTATRYNETRASYGRALGVALNRGDTAEVNAIITEARSKGFMFKPSDIKRWQKTMGQTAAQRRERRTPLALRAEMEDLYALQEDVQ